MGRVVIELIFWNIFGSSFNPLLRFQKNFDIWHNWFPWICCFELLFKLVFNRILLYFCLNRFNCLLF